jgi:hypothetical protein
MSKNQYENLPISNELQLIDKINEVFKCLDVNTFTQKFKNLINDYIRPNYLDPYVYSSNKSFLLSPNINEDRIKKYLIFNNIFVTLRIRYPLPDESFNIIYYKNTEDNEMIIMFWRSITIKVYNRKVLGFPMCIYSTSNNSYNFLKPKEEGTNLYFFKHNIIKTSSLFRTIISNIDEYTFQKCLILYTLYTYGLSSDNYLFEEISTITPTKYTFKIKDMVFSITLTKIIILSPQTVLINIKSSFIDYINSLEEVEKNGLKLTDCDTFYEFFIENYNMYFIKSLYNTKNIKNILELSDETKYLLPGNIYILIQENLSVPVYVIILSENTTHIKYLILFDSTISKTLSMKIYVKNKNDTSIRFFKPDFIFERNLFEYCIG